MRKLLVLAVVGMLGCDSSVESQQQQDLWNALGITNYSFVYTVSCFCGFNGPNPALITVRDGVVTKVDPAPGGAVVPITGPIAAYPTIDSLFAIAARAKAQNPAIFNITYDQTYHFPKTIEVDPVERVADDEISYRVDNFTPSASQ